MDNNLELLSIGDVTIDAFMSPMETETVCSIDDRKCQICFSYGEKIPVRNLDFSVGGNAANNCVGTRRLGVKSAIVASLGSDSTGDIILSKLKEENVDLSFVKKQMSTSSNYSTVINYGGERTIFTYHAPRTYEFPENLPLVSWVYLTSMGENFEAFYNSILEWLNKNPNIKLGLNPGSWQLRAGLTAISGILKTTHMLYVNREEAEKISSFGKSEGKEKELMAEVSKLGPKIVVVTDGENGSFAFNGQVFLHCGVLPISAFERTGAGDAFGAGCVSALVKGKSLDEALLWGTANSASVIGYVGSQKGLLKENEMSVWLDRGKSCGVVVRQI